MFSRILVPLDGSAFAESALPLAFTVSDSCGADVELVTVHEPVPSFAYDEWKSAAEEWSENYLEELKSRASRAGGRIVTTVLSGRVAEALEERAREVDADLVVMATHGRGALTRAWLGSVADTFLRHAPCPVLISRPEEADGGSPPWEPETILVPLDGSELSESILERAVEFGEPFEARLVLTRIVAYPVEVASPYLPHTVQMNQEIVEDARKGAESYLEQRAAPLRERGFTVECEARIDNQAGHGIIKVAEEQEVDMIAMSTHGRGGVARAILGSAADKVIRGAHRPVLVYRPEHH